MKEGIRLRVTVLLVLIVVAVLSSLWAVSRTHGGWEALALNFGTEMAGAVATYALLEIFLGSRERRETKKADLISQLGSSVKDVAVAASEELRREGWLSNGSLQGAILVGANLQWAYLPRANLQGANLSGANLQAAKLMWANLQWAYLGEANLQGADLSWANLQRAGLLWANLEGALLVRAELQDANLRGAILRGADLQGANLISANLQGVVLREVKFDENMTLPDGTKWTPDTDMARFTNPEHPDFWQPDWVQKDDTDSP